MGGRSSRKNHRPKDVIRIASLNARAKLHGSSQELGELLAKKHIDILGAQEVRSKHRIQVTGYNWIGGPDWFSRPPKHLGIGFLVHNQVRGLTSVVSKDKVHEFMKIKLAGKGNVPDTFICVAYCPTHRHPVEKRRSFYAALLESCTSFMSEGDILLVGDFNARLGQISCDRGEANSNGKLLLSLLRSAFADGEDETYVSLLNCSFGCRGLPTREKSGKISIIDYIITSPESITRVQNVMLNVKTKLWVQMPLGVTITFSL
jgi:exonuclease III